MKGIDVSENNGHIDWKSIADAGIEFVMVRSSYGQNSQDSMFAENVNGAHTVGLKVGAYHYGYALNQLEAIQEANNCREVIDNSGVLLDLPVFYDMEDADGYKQRNGFSFDSQEITAICNAFISNVGLDCGVYASYSWLTSIIDWQSLGCSVWNAQWGNTDDIKGFMWQYTDSLEINGKLFDGNECYKESL